MDREELQQATELIELIDSGDEALLSQRLSELHPADIAWAIRDISDQSQAVVLRLLPDEEASFVLMEMDPDGQLALLRQLGPTRARAILGEMGADDIADLLGDVGAADVDEVLGLLAKDDVADVRRLLTYPERSAGGIMTTEFVAIPRTMAADQAIEFLRRHAPDAETVYYVYVVDTAGRLAGVISLRDLIIAPVKAPIESFMETNVISVNAAEDQEEVAQAVARYDLLAVPVVSDDGTLLGIVTVDDVIDVLEEEATEDIQRLGGTVGGEEEIDRPMSRVRKRLPWLVVLLFGNLLAATVLRTFTNVLESVVVLAYFIPVLIGMSGNVGVQSLAVTVRALATREIDLRRIGRIVMREAQVGLVMGVVCGSLVTLIAFFWQGNLYLGIVVGLSMLTAMITGAMLGTMTPLLLDRVGADPAVASGPFITTFCDVIGLIIYFSLASAMMGVVR